MRRESCLWMLAVVVGMLAINMICLEPGIGIEDGTRPVWKRGTYLDQYFGWPSQYRAESWYSPDPNLAREILAFPLAYFPGGKMQLQVRYVGLAAVATNVTFALLLAAAVGVAIEYFHFEVRRQWFLWIAPILVIGLVVILMIASRFDIHL